jgi:anthranilate phosphoribosyltransferase
MSELKAHIAKVATGKPLSFDEAKQAFGIIMSGEATPSQVAGFPRMQSTSSAPAAMARIASTSRPRQPS